MTAIKNQHLLAKGLPFRHGLSKVMSEPSHCHARQQCRLQAVVSLESNNVIQFEALGHTVSSYPGGGDGGGWSLTSRLGWIPHKKLWSPSLGELPCVDLRNVFQGHTADKTREVILLSPTA